eukprot:TRINITY_DN11928_c0_g1_i13.p3 TRINITY_DN11928_c0_g1~~TRINITY_DN11928_c0_g1_i13.p3  ORF type:complete len:108 (-),score=6.76 TRINITY_DN11928_c0_g1_i13:684-1007(-)
MDGGASGPQTSTSHTARIHSPGKKIITRNCVQASGCQGFQLGLCTAAAVGSCFVPSGILTNLLTSMWSKRTTPMICSGSSATCCYSIRKAKSATMDCAMGMAKDVRY